MGFEKPRGYAVALKKLEGFPLMGIEVRDGRLVFASLSHQVSLPLHAARGGGYKVARYGLNKLDVLVREVEYDDQSGCVRILDENGDVIAHVELKNVSRAEQLFSKLHGRSLRGSLTAWCSRRKPMAWPASQYNGGFSTCRWIGSMTGVTKCLS